MDIEERVEQIWNKKQQELREVKALTITPLERVLELARAILEFAHHGDYANGIEHLGTDEGRVHAYDGLKEFERQLKELEEVARLI